MSLKNVMPLITVVTALVGLSFIIFTTIITNQVFPTVGEEAIMVGVLHLQIMGSMVIVFSIFNLLLRDAEEVIAK